MVIGSFIFSGGCALTYFTIQKVQKLLMQIHLLETRILVTHYICNIICSKYFVLRFTTKVKNDLIAPMGLLVHFCKIDLL